MKIEMAAGICYVEVFLLVLRRLLVVAFEVAHRASHGRQHRKLLAALVTYMCPMRLLLALHWVECNSWQLRLRSFVEAASLVLVQLVSLLVLQS